MSYQIAARIFQTNPNAFFEVVEKTILLDGNWTEVYGKHVLRMGGSGTSGTMRLASDTGESFLVALGVHNYKPWTDIVTNLNPAQTGVMVNPEYYKEGTERANQRWKQLSSYNTTNDKGRVFGVTFTDVEGQDLACDIVIG